MSSLFISGTYVLNDSTFPQQSVAPLSEKERKTMERREKKREERKRYRERHPEKVSEEKKRYRERHPEKIKAYRQTYQKRIREALNAVKGISVKPVSLVHVPGPILETVIIVPKQEPVIATPEHIHDSKEECSVSDMLMNDFLKCTVQPVPGTAIEAVPEPEVKPKSREEYLAELGIPTLSPIIPRAKENKHSDIYQKILDERDWKTITHSNE